jgi:hypothetical protein
MTPKPLALPILAGLLLATMPFLHYVHLTGPGEAHKNHEPRHGGQLGMVGEHHIELGRREGNVEVYVSDAWRSPVRPSQGWVVYDQREKRSLRWQGHRLVGEDSAAARVVETIVILTDGTRLALSFDVSDS